MAEHAPITPPQANEVPCFPSPLTGSPIALLFAAMLARLEHFVAAERDIDGVANVFDPAFAQWLHDAELALDHATDALTVLRYMPMLSEGDEALLGFSEAVLDIFGSETPAEASAAHIKAGCLLDILRFEATTDDGHQAQRLLAQVYSHLADVQALALFKPARFSMTALHAPTYAAIPG